jgi:meiotically up-regulated gene 157 (Mug157) protein
MQRVSIKALAILIVVVSIYLYFFPAAKKNRFHAALQKNIDHIFGTWQLKDDTSALILQLNKDTSYTLTQINTKAKDTVSDAGKFSVQEFGINNNTGYGFLTLVSNSNAAVTYEMQLYKMKVLELVDRKTKWVTRFLKQ